MFQDIITLLKKTNGLIVWKREKLINEIVTKIDCLETTFKDSIKQKNDISTSLEKINNSYIELENSKNVIEEKLIFINKALSAKKNKSNIGFNKFYELFENDFINFANKEGSLAEEAAAFLKMQHVVNELSIIVNYPEILTKKIIAIGGGFSSGKSAYINSLIKDKQIQLAEGIRPVTVIPSYVINGSDNRIYGYSNNGGVFPISKSLYNKIDHNFMKGFDFNLNEIVRFISIQTQFIQELNNLCFIDTPGYNPASTGFQKYDIDIARKYIKDAECLIWMIPASAGTVPSSDLDFLDQLESEKKRRLFFILSRSDERPLSEIESILDSIEDILKDNYIEYEGIAAYSSYSNNEYPFRKLSLSEFLVGMNKPGDRFAVLKDNINDVFDMYENAINNSISKNIDIARNLKSLYLDLLENGFEEVIDIERKMSDLHKNFTNKVLEEHLKICKSLRSSFINALEQTKRNLI